MLQGWDEKGQHSSGVQPAEERALPVLGFGVAGFLYTDWCCFRPTCQHTWMRWEF